jgi:hypothetical protein
MHAPGPCRAEPRVGGDHVGAVSAASEHHCSHGGVLSDQRVRTVLCRGWRWRTGGRSGAWTRAVACAHACSATCASWPAGSASSSTRRTLRAAPPAPPNCHRSLSMARVRTVRSAPALCCCSAAALPCRYPFVHPNEDLNPRPQCVPQQRANHWGLAVLSRSPLTHPSPKVLRVRTLAQSRGLTVLSRSPPTLTRADPLSATTRTLIPFVP